MTERNGVHHPDRIHRNDQTADEGGLRAPAELSALGKVWWWFHFAVLVKLARLRFLAILVAIGAVIAYWDTLTAYYDKWTRPLSGQETAAGADAEYWCPMHPTIVRDHPDKCPICAMPLSKRKKGEKDETEALPPGVVSRVQLTPYKVAVAGIETAEIGYQELTKDITAVGFVEFDERKLARITVRATGKSRIDKLHVNVTGQCVNKGDPLAELYSPDLVVTIQNLLDARQSGNTDLQRMARDRLRLWGIGQDQISEIVRTGKPITHVTIRSPISGHVIKKYQTEGEYVEEGMRLYDVADLSTVWIEAQVYEDEISYLKKGICAHSFTRAFPNRDFPGKLALIYPQVDTASRTLKVRFDIDNPDQNLHPGMYATVKLQVPVTGLKLLPADASEEQKAAYAKGKVLVVPERAVIDTGSRRFVYRESQPDQFDGVEVELGPRSGEVYPVVRGLRAGDRVATTGSFLIDAETRLTAGAGSTYFGASGGPQGDHRSATHAAARPSMTREEDSKVQAGLGALSAADRAIAQAQGYCPVLGTRLGAMGPPEQVTIRGQKVYLCCKGCIKKATTDETATLARVAELRAKVKNTPPTSNSSAGTGPAARGSDRESKVRANLAKLSAGDRSLAEAQRFCAIQPESRLGEMGVPISVEIKGRKVFLCCSACKDEALEHPDQTLAALEKRKSAGPPAPKASGHH
jgi:Cu(I)/Ag(I) efflux system membrane fusion protein